MTLLSKLSGCASTQKRAAWMFDRRHDETLRLNTPMIATKYANPAAIGIDVTSGAHT